MRTLFRNPYGSTEPPRGEGAHDARLLLAAVASVSLVVSALVLLVLVRMGDVQAGYEMYALQKRKVELTQQRSALLLELSALRRPDRLARAGSELGLAPPRADQMLRLDVEPSAPADEERAP